MPYRRLGFSDRLSTTVKNVDGAFADPGTLVLKIKDPAGTVATHNWAGDITRDGLGLFHFDLAGLTALGGYSYKWNSTGTNLGVSPNLRYFTLVDEWTPILLTLDEAKSLANTGDVPDPDLELFVDSATETMEKKIGPIVPKVVTAQPATMLGGGRLWLTKHNWVVPGSITAATQNGVAVSTTGWIVEQSADGDGTGFVTLPTSTYLSGAVTVSYTAGFDPIPTPLKEAAAWRAQHSYETQRGPGEAAFGEAVEGVGSSFLLLRRAEDKERDYLIPAVA